MKNLIGNIFVEDRIFEAHFMEDWAIDECTYKS